MTQRKSQEYQSVRLLVLDCYAIQDTYLQTSRMPTLSAVIQLYFRIIVKRGHVFHQNVKKASIASQLDPTELIKN